MFKVLPPASPPRLSFQKHFVSRAVRKSKRKKEEKISYEDPKWFSKQASSEEALALFIRGMNCYMSYVRGKRLQPPARRLCTNLSTNRQV